MNKFLTIMLIAFTVISSSTFAAKGDHPFGANALFSHSTTTPDTPSSVPNSQVDLDLGLNGGIETWGAEGDAQNIIETCLTGGSITGIEWNITIATIGASWLSEPTMKFSNSTQTGDMLYLTVGVGDDAPGTMTYSSGGIIDLTDNAIPDIFPGVDGLLQIEFFDSFDDNAGAPDALMTGSMSVHGIDLVAAPGPDCRMLAQGPPPVVPVNNKLALLLLVLVMMGFVAFRRFA